MCWFCSFLYSSDKAFQVLWGYSNVMPMGAFGTHSTGIPCLAGLVLLRLRLTLHRTLWIFMRPFGSAPRPLLATILPTLKGSFLINMIIHTGAPLRWFFYSGGDAVHHFKISQIFMNCRASDRLIFFSIPKFVIIAGEACQGLHLLTLTFKPLAPGLQSSRILALF